ncbi:Oidioi.mRNA.OKI2018_I69.PAR.g9154.t2.cds [Oikopleura dioica]|nr:Oidioi.mRNA.OKI2018_I69.PAR.g9154.t2.cds [Oikopleura dioica]
MMMFMEEQEKAAASKSSAARSVKKMPAFVDYQTDQPSLTGTGVVRVAVPIPQNFVEPKIERKPIKTGRIEQIYDDAPEPEPTLKFLPNKPSMDLVSSTPKPAEDHKARIKIAASEEARAIVASAATRNASIENEDEIFVEKNFDNQVEVKTAQNVETKTIEVENGILTTEVTTTKTTVSSSRQITYSHQETIDYDDREVTRNETVISNSSSENTKVEADNLDMSFGDIKIEPEHLRPPSPAQEKVEESKIELSILDILKQTHFDEEPQEIVITAKRDRGASLGLSITSPLEEPAVDVPLAADTVIIKDIVVSSSASFNQSPKIGDVLVSIDGIEINSSNIESELQNCGNLITLKFKRFPSAFSGYN